jgi:sulfate/thiosulfate transport system permease protein
MSVIHLPWRRQASAAGSRWGRRLLIGAVVAYIGTLILAPLAALAAGAFAHGMSGFTGTFSDPTVSAAFSLTLQICLMTVAINGLGGLVVTWVIVRHRFPGRRILLGLIDLPFAVSPVIVGFMLILLFGSLGPLAGIEDALGLQIVFAVPGMVIATVFVTLPLMIRELIPVLERLDREQERAAATLGAPRWQIFLRVTLPAIRWALAYGLVLTFARALGEFGAVLIVGGDIQGYTETIPLYIFRALDERSYTAAYALALTLAAASFLLVIGIERVRARGRRST